MTKPKDRLPKLRSIQATPDKLKDILKPFSNSVLDALNTCPMWGIIRYGYRRSFVYSARSMALEAGHVMHEVFAACRLWQLAFQQGERDRAFKHAHQLYTTSRWDQCFQAKSDPRDELLTLCFNVLNTSDFYDDPTDKIRTISNMEQSTIRYVDEHLAQMEAWPIYFDDFVTGVEQVFDIVLTYTDSTQIRLIGTIDAILRSVRNNRIYIGENKTANRPDDVWRSAFTMSHQVSGYCAGASTLITPSIDIRDAKVFGIKVKQTGHTDDYNTFQVKRDEEFISNWAAWVYHTVQEIFEPYFKNWEEAPRYTHSCNRYFRTCSMVPFCADTAEGRIEQFNKDMVQVEPTPSEQRILRQKMEYS